MASLNAALRAAFDLLLAPAAGLPPIWPIVVVSLGVAILMLVVFKRTSDQKRLAAVKRQITAGIFEIRLFSDDLVAILLTTGIRRLALLHRGLIYLPAVLPVLVVGIVFKSILDPSTGLLNATLQVVGLGALAQLARDPLRLARGRRRRARHRCGGTGEPAPPRPAPSIARSQPVNRKSR